MAAANTDLFKKVARKWVGQIGSGGVADSSTTTVPLLAVTNLPTDTAVVATINRVNDAGTKTPDSEESVVGVVSGSNLVNCTRGAEGTAQSHDAGDVVEILITNKGWEDMVDGIVTEHNQLGGHTDITACDITASGTNTALTGSVTGVLTASETVVQTTLAASDITASNVSACEITFSNADPDLAVSTGNITVAGADPWRTISLPASAWEETTTAGCAAIATTEAGTNDIDYKTLDFDTGSDENAFCNWQMPDSWDAGVVQFRYIWTTASGGAAETVTFELSGISYADNDPIDAAVGTAVEVADTWIADGDIHQSAWSGNVTLSGTPAAGEFVHFEIMRDVSEDDLGGDVRLMGVQIRYRQTRFSD